jgi:hypothetical protein
MVRYYATSQKVESSESDAMNDILAIYLLLPATLGLGDYSSFNTNEYQKPKNNGGWHVRLTILLPSVSQVSRQCGLLNISQPYRPP